MMVQHRSISQYFGALNKPNKKSTFYMIPFVSSDRKYKLIYSDREKIHAFLQIPGTVGRKTEKGYKETSGCGENVFIVLILLIISLCINMPEPIKLCISSMCSKLYVNYTCIKLLRIATSLTWTLQNRKKKKKRRGRFEYGFFFFLQQVLLAQQKQQ